jgi:hypothetical protein
MPRTPGVSRLSASARSAARMGGIHRAARHILPTGSRQCRRAERHASDGACPHPWAGVLGFTPTLVYDPVRLACLPTGPPLPDQLTASRLYIEALLERVRLVAEPHASALLVLALAAPACRAYSKRRSMPA